MEAGVVSHPDHVKQQNVAETLGSVVTESLFHNHGFKQFCFIELNVLHYIGIRTTHEQIDFHCY
ncbi:hypothetical protein Hanom_Chr05g00435831 [Helianthus anomalus]